MFISVLHSGARGGILEVNSPGWTSLAQLCEIAFGPLSTLTSAVSCGNVLHS